MVPCRVFTTTHCTARVAEVTGDWLSVSVTGKVPAAAYVAVTGDPVAVLPFPKDHRRVPTPVPEKVHRDPLHEPAVDRGVPRGDGVNAVVRAEHEHVRRGEREERRQCRRLLLRLIETPQGIWFVKLIERRDGGPIDYEQAKRTISQRLYRQKRRLVYADYVGKLKNTITVQEFPDKLEAALEKSRSQSGPPMGPVRAAQ